MGLDFMLCYKDTCLVDFNITHNVSGMWCKAGCYEALYESENKKAKDVVGFLIEALNEMILHPFDYEKLEPDNGWGTYKDAIHWLLDVSIACTKYPDATIRVDR